MKLPWAAYALAQAVCTR